MNKGFGITHLLKAYTLNCIVVKSNIGNQNNGETKKGYV